MGLTPPSGETTDVGRRNAQLLAAQVCGQVDTKSDGYLDPKEVPAKTLQGLSPIGQPLSRLREIRAK
jgi:hypothetical protein